MRRGGGRGAGAEPRVYTCHEFAPTIGSSLPGVPMNFNLQFIFMEGQGHVTETRGQVHGSLGSSILYQNSSHHVGHIYIFWYEIGGGHIF